MVAVTELCPVYAPFFSAIGTAAAVIFTSFGAAYGTAKSGVGIVSMGVMRPDLVMKNVVPVIMAGIIAIYGLVVGVLIINEMEQGMTLFQGFIGLAAGLSVGLGGLAAGVAVGIVGDAGVRAVGQQPRVFVGMLLILIFAEVLGLYGLIERVVAFQRVLSSYRAVPRCYYSSTSTADNDGRQQQQSPVKSRKFKAETKKLLDIVANSLYSDKEVFCRELVSNSADALEKLRHENLVSGGDSGFDESSLKISIDVDSEKKTFSIRDNGIGMTEDEMVNFLGTIAKSGSKSFVEAKDKKGSNAGDSKENIIGQFGVGFYSSFMVGDKVEVFSKSAKTDDVGKRWESDGLGSYTVNDDPSAEVGTKIVIHLKEDSQEFGKKEVIEGIIKKYSNFVNFPIELNGEKINTIEPLWKKDPSAVTEDEHNQFYRFISNAWDSYQYKLNYRADAPLHINTLLYVPERNTEMMGIGRMESGVSLYSKKVLIQGKSQKLLPDYLRFMRGVVESDDIPMNLSREMLQNSALISKLSDVLTGKVLRWLGDEQRKDREKFNKFYQDFSVFLKEGVCMGEPKHQKDLGKLLQFESSSSEPGTMVTLGEYLARAQEDQDKIFYMIASSRKWAEESPYLDAFKEKGYEVLFMSDTIDEFVVDRLPDYGGKKLLSIDSSEAMKLVKKEETSAGISAEEETELRDWFKKTLGKQVSEIKFNTHLTFPAVVTDHDSPTVRRMLKMAPKQSALYMDEPPNKLEVNPHHKLVLGIRSLIRDGLNERASDITHQIFDNALIAAGIMDDPRVMLKRLNRILESSVGASSNQDIHDRPATEGQETPESGSL